MTDVKTHLSAAEIHTSTLEVPGAVLTYDVRGQLDTGRTPLLLVGTPMEASGFVTLASHFTDRPVVTYDPRNVGRSHCTTDATPTPDDHAADLHALIGHLGGGPVDLFGSSGGAINALALAIAHPADLRFVLAHEPPLAAVLPDAEHLIAACRHVQDSYQRSGFGLGMATFITLVSAQGPIDADYLSRPDPDPGMFGMPTADDGSRDDPMMANMSTVPTYPIDVDALSAVSDRVVLGVGEESGETMAARAPRALAEQTGLRLVVFPSDHSGFLGGEFGQTGKPDEFAAALRQVLPD